MDRQAVSKSKSHAGRYAALFFAALAFVLISAPGANGAAAVNPFAGLYQKIIDQATQTGLPGLAVYIRTPEEGVWIGTGGYADLETRTRIHPESLFYSASHLKIFMATAVMMLWDAGFIDLDAPVERYLPVEISARLANASTATVRNLLNHTSGIPNYVLTTPWTNNPLESTWRDDIDSILGKKADFAPGSQFRYCNTNFVLLAVILDQVTGDHADFLSRRIFQPLGMTHTYYRKEAGLPRPPRLVTPYLDRYGDGTLESVGTVFPTVRQNHAYGAGGLLADMSDYARFIEALFGGQLISPEALKLMSTPVGPASLYGYGLGMIIQRTNGVDEAKFGKSHGHGGRGPFGILEMDYYPKAGVTIGYAANYGSPGKTTVEDFFNSLGSEFGDAVFNKRVPARGTPLEPIQARPSKGKTAQLRQSLYQGVIDQYVRKGLPGMVMLIKTPERGTWVGAKGYARLEDRSPMRPETVFSTLGVTRLFTAAAVMILRDEGRIDLDATIDRYLPPDIADKVANSHSATVRHLLAFVSGIPNHSVDVPPWNTPRLNLTWRDKLAEIYGLPARFAPAQAFEFSNASDKLLAMIIDRVAGSHVGFFRERFVTPLGLSNTYYKSEPGLPHLPAMADSYYDRYGDGNIENIGADMRVQLFAKGYGDTGLFSTVTDIARFLEALFGGELVTAASLQEMMTVAFPRCHPNVGLGFKVYDQLVDARLRGPAYWAGGWGFSGWFDFYVFPQAGVIIGWGANLAAANVDGAGVFDYFDIIRDAAAAVFSGRG